MIQNAYKSVKGLFSQIDPSNVDSDVSPGDLHIEKPEPVEDEFELVQLVKNRFTSASAVKQIHVREWLICQAFRMGNQWVEWRRGELFDLRDPDDNKRNYATIDVIDHLLRKLKARATMSKPDASVKPLTSSRIDRLAAAEARDILAHYDSQFNRQEQSLEWVDSVLSSSTTFLKVIWDSTAKILAPTTKGVAEYQELGDIDEIVVPPFEVFPDPAARNWTEVTWLIHAKDRPLSYIQAKYGKRGYLVEGSLSKGDASNNWAEQRLDNINGDSILPASSDLKMATVYECWELPSPRYPKGRLIRVAGDVLLTEPTQIDWPYKKNDEFPFVPLTYEKRPRGLWSLNAVTRLVKPQMAFNKAVSRMQDRIDNDKVLILEPRGAETGADNDYESPSAMRRVRHEPGFIPQVFQPSPFNEALLSYANFIRSQMEDISGVHEVSNGSVPAGVTAGNAIELLQQSDQTQMSEFVTCIETAQKKRAEWEIALVSQFYSEPRLVAVSTLPEKAPTPPQAPPMLQQGPQPPMMGQQQPPPPTDDNAALDVATAVKVFEGLTKGGQVRIEVVPGSATPKTPAAQSQQILDMAAKGFFTPQMLPVLKMVADELGLARSDTFTDRIDEAYATIMANTPPPEVAAAQQQQQAQQAEQMKQQADQEHYGMMAAIDESKANAIDDHATDNKIRLAQATAQANAQANAAKSAQEHQQNLDKQQADHHHDAAMLDAQAAMPVVPSVSLAPIPVAPETAVDAARAAGYQSGSVADIKKQQEAALKPAPMNGSKPSGGKK